jgi:mRNA interferase YafQ
LDKLFDLVDKLANGEKIPAKHKDHQLKGKLKDFRDLHIEPDWILIYQIEGDKLRLIGTGSHAYLFDN